MDSLLFSGFGDSYTYNAISHTHPVLFRLQSNESLARGDGPKEPLIAPRYASLNQADLFSIPIFSQSTYAEVARHVNVYRNMKKRDSIDFRSPWVSATWNFPYLMWEASRRLMYRFAKEHELYIVMIDGRHPAVRERAVTAVDLLHSLGGDHGSEEWRFANACQEVLVHGFVDPAAVLCTMHWTELRLLIQEEYLQPNFLVAAEVGAREMLLFQSYCWHLAVELKKRYNRYELMKSSVHLATHLISKRTSSLTDEPEDTVAMLVEITRSVGFWVDRAGGPYGDKGSDEDGETSTSLQVFRSRVIDIAIKLPMFVRWSELLRLELRMEQIKQRYAGYKRMVKFGEPTDSRPKQLRDALQQFADEMP